MFEVERCPRGVRDLDSCVPCSTPAVPVSSMIRFPRFGTSRERKRVPRQASAFYWGLLPGKTAWIREDVPINRRRELSATVRQEGELA